MNKEDIKKLDEIKQLLEISVQQRSSHHSDIVSRLEKIEAQVLKTNGRVTVLESEKDKVSGWIKAMSITGVIIMSLVVYIFTTTVNAQKEYEKETRSLIKDVAK